MNKKLVMTWTTWVSSILLNWVAIGLVSEEMHFFQFYMWPQVSHLIKGSFDFKGPDLLR